MDSDIELDGAEVGVYFYGFGGIDWHNLVSVEVVFWTGCHSEYVIMRHTVPAISTGAQVL